MSRSLVSSVSNIVAGTAVAGFGFSFGRDIYRFLKKTTQKLIIPILIVIVAIFPVVAAVFTFRWYPISFIRWFFTIFFPLTILLVVSIYFTIVIITFGFIFFEINYILINGKEFREVELSTIYTIVTYFIGILEGVRRRSKRKHIYDIELENDRFLDHQGIKEVSGASSFTHEDSSGNKLRLTSIGKDIVEFFVVGRRGKRAFIYLDNEGRFTEYTGVVNS